MQQQMEDMQQQSNQTASQTKVKEGDYIEYEEVK